MRFLAIATAIAMTALLGLFGAASANAFDLKITGFKDGDKLKIENVFNGFGCTGGNVSPEISWTNPPKGALSFVLTVYDPDAPTGSGWWHWVVYNIPATAKGVAVGAGAGKGLPEGTLQGRTDFGSAAYGGPCPPPGKPHRYIFTLTALKVAKLEVPADASAALIGFMTNANKLGQAKITLMYGR